MQRQRQKAGVKRGRGRPKKQAVGQKARRAWRVVPQPFKDWLLDYQAHMYELEGWDSVRCLRHAQELCPEVFSHVLPSVPRRWVHSRDLASDAQHGGRRHCKVSPAARSVLLELAHKVSSKVAMNTFILKELFNKRLAALGSEHKASRAWVRSLLRAGGFKWKRRAKKDSVSVTEAEKEELQRLLRARLAWSMAESSISFRDVWNLDETSVMLYPEAQSQLGCRRTRELCHWRS